MTDSISDIEIGRQRAAIISSLVGTIVPEPIGIGERLIRIAVAVLMALLPVAYAGVVALVGYGAYWHATENHVIMSSWPNAPERVARSG